MEAPAAGIRRTSRRLNRAFYYNKAAFRDSGLAVVHTKECHRADLADCPPSKLTRGGGSLKIGDEGPMGRILIEGEPGNDFISSLAPRDAFTP